MKNNYEIPDDYYIADYLIKSREIIKDQNIDSIITMQWFQRKENIVLCGIEYIINLLKVNLPNFDDLEIWALNDGDIINPNEPVLKITGKYEYFAFLEGFLDGILTRASNIATNSRNICIEAKNKEIINMNDRIDLFSNQELDGYSSYVGGIKKFVSLASIALIEDGKVEKPQGTMPHSLIQWFGGDLIKALTAYSEKYPELPLVALVDYNNDCVNDTIKVAKHFGDKLYAIRIDTSDNLVDKSLESIKNPSEKLNGVNPTLIKLVREKLDSNGFKKVKIIASSGFDAKKIQWFSKENTPVDIYGVGAAITNKVTSFTGDSVMLNGVGQAKIGRKDIESKRLKKIN